MNLFLLRVALSNPHITFAYRMCMLRRALWGHVCLRCIPSGQLTAEQLDAAILTLRRQRDIHDGAPRP